MVRRGSAYVAIFPKDLFAYFLGQCQKVGPGACKAQKRKYEEITASKEKNNLHLPRRQPNTHQSYHRTNYK